MSKRLIMCALFLLSLIFVVGCQDSGSGTAKASGSNATSASDTSAQGSQVDSQASQDQIRASFEALLKNPGNEAAALEQMRQDLSKLSPENADQMILSFEAYQNTAISDLPDISLIKLMQTETEDPYNEERLNNPSSIQNTDLKNALQEFLNRGYKLIIPEGMGLANSCAAAALGCVLGELGSCFIQFVLYRKAIKNQSRKNSAPTPHLFHRLLHIAAPTALSSYVTSGIRTIEQLLIPYGLKKGGASGSGALATFGIIRGMAMPLILFPAFLLSTALDLVLPELTESQAAGHLRHLSYIIRRVYRMGILFSVCMMWIFLRFSHELGMLIYQSTDAAYFIRRLAILAPFFYLDMITDMMVRGLGRHMSTMKYNLITSLVSVVLLYLLLPKFAITGYLITVYCSKILNFTLSLHKLVHISDLKFRLFDIFKAVLCVVASAQLANLMSRLLPAFPEPFSFLTQIALTILFYILNLRIFACVSREDIAWCRSLLK